MAAIKKKPPRERIIMMSKHANAMPKGRPKNKITYELLNSLDIPDGGSVAIYDRLSRRALFYRNNGGRYTQVLARDKRGTPIMHRDDDMIMSLDFDGTVIPGDPFHAFISESEKRRRVQERSIIQI